MEVQLRSYYRPGRSFNTLSNPSSKFKGNRNKKFVCNLNTKSGKFQKALNAQIICAFPVIYDIKPSREGGYLFPCPPPPPPNKDNLVPKKNPENLFSYVMVFPNIAFVRSPNLSNFPFCSPIPMNFSPVPLPRRTLVSHIQIVIDHPGISLRVCGVVSRPN